jgi:hypothetical protein
MCHVLTGFPRRNAQALMDRMNKLPRHRQPRRAGAEVLCEPSKKQTPPCAGSRPVPVNRADAERESRHDHGPCTGGGEGDRRRWAVDRKLIDRTSSLLSALHRPCRGTAATAVEAYATHAKAKFFRAEITRGTQRKWTPEEGRHRAVWRLVYRYKDFMTATLKRADTEKVLHDR